MRKYLIKSGLFLFLCFLILTLVMLKFGGNIDYFYVKFTTPKAKSMIVGDSRSMQGIQPRVINEQFKNINLELPIFNYSFTVAQAPIGPLYNESIERKLDKSSNKGIFIISMTPWMLASYKNNSNEKGEFREADEPPHNMYFVNVNPNYEYLLKNLNYFHFKALFRKTTTMHEDGWLEENNPPNSPETFEIWKKNQSKMFDKMIDEYKVSSYRLDMLYVLIKKLKKYGSVYVVRMPIDRDFVEKERLFYPDFDEDMKDVCQTNNIPYINFNQSDATNVFKTYDGHHLDKEGGSEFTAVLCDSIAKHGYFHKIN